MSVRQVPRSTFWYIAAVAHEANRALCQGLGDDSQVPWEEAEGWQRDSAIDGVLAVYDGRVQSPGDSHRNWLEEKARTGWVYGPEKDPEKKRHPCMVPFEELPRDQQLKDHVFIGVVRALLARIPPPIEEGS